MIVALLTLYQADFNERWIDAATELTDQMLNHFADDKENGSAAFYFTADDHENLIARVRDFQDSSVPNGNALAATGLQMLGHLTGQDKYLERANRIVAAASSLINRAPMAAGQMLVAANNMLDQHYEVVLLGPTEASVQQALATLREQFLPNVSIICRTEDRTNDRSKLLDAILLGKKVIGGEVTLFICQNHACQKPVTGEDAVIEALKTVGK
jgi:uncharacterized protein YyaL (SSP411 family)